MATSNPISGFRRNTFGPGGAIATVKKLVGFDLHNRLSQKSPVDTGRFRASWNLSVGEADLSVASGGHSSTPVIGEIPPGVPVVVSNNLPYGPRLNEGSSSQAPAGFVEAAVDEVQAAMDGIVDDVRRQFE